MANDQQSTEDRLAALRARRGQFDAPIAETRRSPSPPRAIDEPSAPHQTQRRSPARSAKIMTVGVSTTAVIGLMGAYGKAANSPSIVPATEVTETTLAPGAVRVEPQTPTIQVAADSSVVVVVVDEFGRPIDLKSMASVSELAAFLQQAEPIVPVWTTAIAEPATATAIASLPTSPSSVSGGTASTTAVAPPQIADQSQSAAPTVATQATQSTVAPVATPATTTSPAPAAVAAPETTTAPAPAPAPTVPVAQPAPIELSLPAPAPTGNSGGS